MKTDELNQLWGSQHPELPTGGAQAVLAKAKKQRNTQLIGIAVMTVTVLILTLYAGVYAAGPFNTFKLGLTLMIGSLLLRIVLEWMSMYRKANRLVTLDYKGFKAYLQKHYRLRLQLNYVITPLCFGVYVYGFSLLLPYFEREFSKGFYYYLLISGSLSILGIGILIFKKIRQERNFLKELLEV